MEEKSNNKLTIILLIILVLVLGCLCVLFATGTIKLNDKKESNENTQEKQNETITKEEAKSLVNKYVSNTNIQGGDLNLDVIKKNGLTDNVKLDMAIGKLSIESEVKCEDAFDKNAVEGYRRGGETGYYGCSFNSLTQQPAFSYDSVNSKYKELFGSSSNAPKTNSFYFYEYSSKLNKYVIISQMASSSKIPGTIYDVVSVNSNNDKLNVEVKYLDYTSTMHGLAYSFDNNTTNMATDYNELKSVFDNNLDKLSSVTFVFEKINNEYILVSAN